MFKRNLSNHVKWLCSSCSQGLVNVPFWEYWTSPYSSHYRPYTQWLGDVQWGHLMTHGSRNFLWNLLSATTFAFGRFFLAAGPPTASRQHTKHLHGFKPAMVDLYQFCLVLWNMICLWRSHHIGSNHHPNWLSLTPSFFKGVETNHQPGNY